MNLKKILAGVAAGAMIVSTLALPTFADDTVDTVTYDYETTYPIVIDPSASPNYVQFNLADFDLADGAAIQTITIVAGLDGLYDYANGVNGEGYWYGGGGSVGLNIGDLDGDENSDWIQVDFALGDASTDPTNLTIDWDTDTVTITLDISDLTSGMVYDTEGDILQIGWWWCCNDIALSIESISVGYEYVEEPVVTALTAEGVSYDTPYVVTSADDTENDYVSGVIHIDALNYNDSTYAAYWNDWCQLEVAVTVDGVTTYYAVVGAQVGWDITVDDCGTEDETDDIKVLTTDENFIVLDTENGTDIAVDLEGDEWSIEVIALGWNGSEEECACAYATASVTLTTAKTESNSTTESNSSTESNSTIESNSSTGSNTSVATSSSNNDANTASDDGDFAYAYLFAIVALAGVALVGSKKYHA